MSMTFRRSLSAIGLALALPLAAVAGTVQVSVIDRDGNPVPDAVVVLVPPAFAPVRAPLPTKVTITQEKMRFLPAVALVGVGTQATFVNNDPWEHHVRASAAGVQNFDSASTGGFELRLDGKPDGKPGKTAEARFDKAGPVLLGCHLHASMRAHVYVSDTPWATLTGPDGQAAFDAVPEGAVKVRVWQADQLIDLPAQQLAVGATPAKATLQLSVVPRRRRA
jgi:plastocyanin